MNTNKNKLITLTWLIKKAYEESLYDTKNHYDLSPSEGAILLFLFKHDFDTAKEISEYRSMSKSLVSKSINNLLKRELITLKVDCEDKRIHRIELSKNANEIIEKLTQDEQNFYSSLEEGLNSEDRASLNRIMNILYDNVKKEN